MLSVHQLVLLARCRVSRVSTVKEKSFHFSRNLGGVVMSALKVAPVHGLIVTSSGLSRRAMNTPNWVGTFVPWMKRMLGACAVASAIAMGLFVYTEFVQAWKVRGLPTIPITALSAIEQAGQAATTPLDARPGPQPQGQPRQQKLSQFDDYTG